MRIATLLSSAVVLACVLPAPAFAAEPPTDVTGWRGAAWGMDTDALRQVFGRRLTPLAAPWRFGPGMAESMIADVAVGGRPMRAFPQMDHETGGLRQLLLEIRPPALTVAAYVDIRDALIARYGAPHRTCSAPHVTGAPRVVHATWSFPTTTIHLGAFDFFTPAMVFDDPNIDDDPLTPRIETRRNIPRFLPRRLVVRFHATADRALAPEGGCADTGN